jgi:hypothetical protein
MPALATIRTQTIPGPRAIVLSLICNDKQLQNVIKCKTNWFILIALSLFTHFTFFRESMNIALAWNSGKKKAQLQVLLVLKNANSVLHLVLLLLFYF